MDKVRIDKWLWAVRIFKSRTLAGEVVRQGKVRLADKIVKPSANVAVGDTVTVTKNGFHLQFEVLKLIDKRVGAPIAATCYADRTPPEELTKYQDWFVGKAQGEFRERGAGRPTKRDRREIDTFKDEDFSFEFEDED
ncbi:RNA-binding S4 domain-containing protein [Neolewinella lacunae]|uniref:RNA-binding S4 domain-containing protein n=1 Tax=Neolewinella lacunae TaxID=1517758 RepID=A0A923PNF8_9BACT|nr:RNA-binding S4 domain-containing protein [Neolewinella lacunae]MBC6996674.1 RNA-binding S4 domain-containing protein [Neolewinella lacunae]MDN3634761.1 RNA-binding S4 domain-containing protein [Neolewinella lacunae]